MDYNEEKLLYSRDSGSYDEIAGIIRTEKLIGNKCYFLYKFGETIEPMEYVETVNVSSFVFDCRVDRDAYKEKFLPETRSVITGLVIPSKFDEVTWLVVYDVVRERFVGIIEIIENKSLRYFVSRDGSGDTYEEVDGTGWIAQFRVEFEQEIHRYYGLKLKEIKQ